MVVVMAILAVKLIWIDELPADAPDPQPRPFNRGTTFSEATVSVYESVQLLMWSQPAGAVVSSSSGLEDGTTIPNPCHGACLTPPVQ
jgi:hypothetical protein